MKLRRPEMIICGTMIALIVIAWIVNRNWYWWHLSSDERMVAMMDRGTNITTTFFGKVVDENGSPIASAEVDVVVGGINENWGNSPTGGRERDAEQAIHAATDASGAFTFTATGTIIQIKSVRKAGYRWLYDLQTGEQRGVPYACNSFFEIALEHRPGPYLPDVKSPAVFVLVHDGVSKVNALPSRGGTDVNPVISLNRTNLPAWPVRPSLKDVQYVGQR